MREYFSKNIIFDSNDHYCIWFTEGMAGYITEGNKVKWFSSYEDLLQFTKKHGIRLSDDIESLTIESALEQLKTDGTKDCDYFISIWHIAEDIAGSLDLQFYGKMGTNNTDDIYEKMFRGCNLPAITPKGEEYYPIWTKAEMQTITRIIKDGVNLITNSF